MQPPLQPDFLVQYSRVLATMRLHLNHVMEIKPLRHAADMRHVGEESKTRLRRSRDVVVNIGHKSHGFDVIDAY